MCLQGLVATLPQVLDPGERFRGCDGPLKACEVRCCVRVRCTSPLKDVRVRPMDLFLIHHAESDSYLLWRGGFLV